MAGKKQKANAVKHQDMTPERWENFLAAHAGLADEAATVLARLERAIAEAQRESSE